MTTTTNTTTAETTPPPIRIYNTLSQRKEPLQTVRPGAVGMYVCGPTVYSKSHIGHMVGPVIFDAVKRHLAYSGYAVTWVVNITDVDDKLIVQAQKDGTTVKDLAERVTADYLDCLARLGVDGIDAMPRATDHIGEIVALAGDLIAKGFAYEAGGDVYFDVTKAPTYGKLSHRDPEELQAGARVETSSLKRGPGDFALWKSAKPGEPAWESPWGPGRPGWHIECSAMSMKLLGSHFDIHGGGLDLVFPHHENEVVQSESASGEPFATYWMHNGLVMRQGRKISKSDPETIVLIDDILKVHDADTLRVLFLAGHYRRPIDYGPTRLDELAKGLGAFRALADRFERIAGESFYTLEAPTTRAGATPSTLAGVDELRTAFLDAMDDDFNTGGALGSLYELVRVLNRRADSAGLDAAGRDPAATADWRSGVVVLKELTNVLGLFRRAPDRRAAAEEGSGGLVDGLLGLLVEIRAQARRDKNYKLGDDVRKGLVALGVTLEDRADGTTWKVEPRPLA